MMRNATTALSKTTSKTGRKTGDKTVRKAGSKSKRKGNRKTPKNAEQLFQVGPNRPTWELEDNIFSTFASPCSIRLVANSQVEVVRLDQEESDLSIDQTSGKWEQRNILFVPVAMTQSAFNRDRYMGTLMTKLNGMAEDGEMEEEEGEKVTDVFNMSSSDDDTIASNRRKCEVCGKLMWAKYLKEHMLTHSTSKKKKGQMVEKTGRKPNSSAVGSSSAEKKSDSDEDEDSDEGKRSDKICITCKKVVNDLTEHIPVHHKNIRDRCAGCGKTFKGGDSYLQKHWNVCRGQSKCKPCGVAINSQVEFVKHQKCRARGRRDPLPCETCGRIFYEEFKLKRHRLIHSGVQSHFCDHCGRGFIRKDYVNRHMKNCVAAKEGSKTSKDVEVK